MNNYIVYPLMLLIVIGVFSQLYFSSSTNIDFSSQNIQQNLSQNQSLNDTESQLEINDMDINVTLDMQNSLLVMIGIAIALCFLGIAVFGSYIFNAVGQKMMFNITIYYSIWTIFSLFSYSMFSFIPLGFGALFWFILTTIYSLGVFNKLGS